jgi:hypothetical protein
MKRIGIEELLRWAYRDELPKMQSAGRLLPPGYGSAWGGVERYGELLTVVDAPENKWGLVPDFAATTSPHPDAIRVGEAVCALDALELDLPKDWNPLGDWVSLGDEATRAANRALNRGTYVDDDGARRLKTAASQLMRKYAVLGGTPEWQGEEPEAKLVVAANGRPRWFRRALVMVDPGDPQKGIAPVYEEREVNGLDKRRVPLPDAYTKTVFDPDPADTALNRAEYEVWRAALDVLVEDLNGLVWSEVVNGDSIERVGLADFKVINSLRPFRPWETGDLPPQRVLPDLTTPKQPPPVLRPRRPRLRAPGI